MLSYLITMLPLPIVMGLLQRWKQSLFLRIALSVVSGINTDWEMKSLQSEGRNFSQTTSESAADLNRGDTNDDLHASRADVKEIMWEIHSSGNCPISIFLDFSLLTSFFFFLRSYRGLEYDLEIINLVGRRETGASLRV